MLVQFIVVIVVVFLFVVVILRKLILSDTTSAVNRLKLVDSENKKKEEELQKKKLEAQEAYKEKISQAEKDALNLKENAKNEMDSLKKKLLDEARLESDKIIATAKNIKDGMRQKLKEEFQIRTIDYAVDILRRVFTLRMKERLNEELIEEFLEELERLDKDKFKSEIKQVVVVCADSLNHSMKKRLKVIIEAKIGRSVEIKEELDAELVAGIIVKFNSVAIDGSLSNYLRETAAELKKEVEK